MPLAPLSRSIFRALLVLLPSALVACGGEPAGVGDGQDLAELSPDQTRFIDPPFYFAVPHSAYAELGDVGKLDAPIVDVTVPGLEDSPIGQRVVVYQGANAQESRRKAAKELAAAGILQDGDVILSYRPSWEKTLPYSHLQLGTSHAGLVYVKDGSAHNFDMPLDAQYNGPNFSSRLDAKHYADDSDAFHIVRPRNFTDAKKANLRAWIALAKKNVGAIKATGNLTFQSDYTTPNYSVRGRTPLESVTRLGKILQLIDLQKDEMTMYCSELAWHVLSLASCTPEQIRDATESVAECVEPIHAPMLMLRDGDTPGLAEGPLMLLEQLGVPLEKKLALAGEVFRVGEVAKLSEGHRKLSEAVAPLVAKLEGYYMARLTGQVVPPGAVGALPPANFSPTGFLVGSFAPAASAARAFDYVVTLEFTTEEGLRRAKAVSADDIAPSGT